MFEKLIKILAELIEAINNNTAALQANAGSNTTEGEDAVAELEEGQAADADDAGEEPAEEPGEEPAEEPGEEPAEEPKAKGKPVTPQPVTPQPVTPQPAAKAPTSVSLNDLRTVASALLGKGKAGDVKALLAKFKAESLTKLNEKHYAAVFAALKKL